MMPTGLMKPIARFAETDDAYKAFIASQNTHGDEPTWRGLVDHIGRLVLTKGRFEETYAVYPDGDAFSVVRFEDPLAVLDPGIEYGQDYVWDGHVLAEGVGTVREAFDAVLQDMESPYDPHHKP